MGKNRRRIRACMRPVPHLTTCPSSQAHTIFWLCSTAARRLSLTGCRESDVTRAGKFWEISASNASGSSAEATRCAACRPRSFRSHT
eukprot:364991-Chlamydomonas_euryale.AAC.17